VVRGGGFFPACELVAKRKRKRRARSTLLVIAIAVLIAGFIIRRTLVPRVLHYLAYRPAENPNTPAKTASPSQQVSSQPPPAAPSAAAVATPAVRRTTPAPSEHLTESDRQQLEDILKRRSR
jgi:cytoskeletal protein RodZ